MPAGSFNGREDVGEKWLVGWLGELFGEIRVPEQTALALANEAVRHLV